MSFQEIIADTMETTFRLMDSIVLVLFERKSTHAILNQLIIRAGLLCIELQGLGNIREYLEFSANMPSIEAIMVRYLSREATPIVQSLRIEYAQSMIPSRTSTRYTHYSPSGFVRGFDGFGIE